MKRIVNPKSFPSFVVLFFILNCALVDSAYPRKIKEVMVSIPTWLPPQIRVPEKNARLKTFNSSNLNKGKAMVGLSFGQRYISFLPSEVYYLDQPLNMGIRNPLFFTLFIQDQWKNNAVYNLSFDVAVSKSMAFAGVFSGGYRFENKHFSIVPLFGMGYGRFITELERYSLGKTVTEINKHVFIGPKAYNAGRGGGSDISLNLSSGFFLIKPEIQVQYRVKRFSFIGSLAYNAGIGGKGKIELSGEGYTSKSDYLNSAKPPDNISIKQGNLSDYLKDASGHPLMRTPIMPGGISWTLGLSYSFFYPKRRN